MKFKNYVNSLTGDNRIFSNKEIANMTVKEAFGRQDEILAQHNQIGIPSEKELQASDNVVHVNSYTREDGTEVRAHWRSKPDGIQNNNLSAQKNSSDTSFGTLTGGASGVNMSSEFDSDNNKLLEGYVSTTDTVEDLKDFASEHIKPYRDYEHLEPIEKAQKWASKHTSWWTPSEYYGISEYLADDGKMPEKYAKHNDHYK